MIAAGVRFIADVLNDEATGLAAVLAAGVPMQPEAFDLPAIAVYDDTRHGWVKHGTWPLSEQKKGPCLVVRAADGASADTTSISGGIMTCTVGIHTLFPLGPNQAPADRAGLMAAQYLRAAQRVLRKAEPEEVTWQNPVVFGCSIVPAQERAYRFEPLYDPDTISGGVVIDALLVSIAVDDPWGRGFSADVPPTT
jgi:hypothetical protein